MTAKILMRIAAVTVLLCVAVDRPVTAFARARRHGGVVTTGPRKNAGPVEATTTLDCGAKRYEVSTGNGKGACEMTWVNNKPSSVNCDDGNGNSTHASCGDGCGTSGGAGSCTMK